MRNTCVNTIINCCRKNDDIFIITGDAGLGVFDEYKDKYPERYLNMGVAEQNMMSFAAGLCLSGFNVFVYDIIPFVLYRCYEQVRNDICYQRLPVTLIGIGSGVTYAPGGMTHYSIEDIGLTQTLPNLTVISPSDPIEAKLAANYSLTAKEPVYIRLAKKGEPNIHKKKKFNIKNPQLINDGDKIAILSHGSATIEAVNAVKKLNTKGVKIKLITIPTLQPLNQKDLIKILEDVNNVITVEEHYTYCGLGDIISKLHAEYKPKWNLKTLGIPYKFVHEIKNTMGMRDYFGFSTPHIIKTVKNLLK